MDKAYSTSDFLQLEIDCDKELRKALTIRNLRSYLARKNATIIWGGGMGIDTENKELQTFFEDYSRRYNLLDIFTWCEECCSKYGRAIITINQTQGGQYLLNTPDPLYFNVVARSFYKEDLAVVWQRFNQDQKTWWIRSTYTPYEVKNDIYMDVGYNQIQIFDKESEIPPELRVKKVWKHNFGFLPLVEVQNYPNLLTFQGTFTTWNKQADWYNALVYEDLFCQALDDFKKELRLCHSRVAIENASQQILQDITEKLYGTPNDPFGDVMKDIVIDTPTGSKVSVLHGVADFSSYTNAIDSILDMYCKLANGSKFSEGGGAQKTTQEVRGTRSQQIEAVNLKTMLRERRYTDLLAKLFTCYGFMKYEDNKYPFTFKIHGNLQREDTVFIDNIVKQLNLGTMSTIEAIAQIRKITLTDAEEIFKKIKEFNEANNIVSNISQPMIEEEGMEETDRGGRPVETDEVS